MNNEEKFQNFRKKYHEFVYEKYEIEDLTDFYQITFYFSISGLTKFKPSLKISKKSIFNKHINENILNNLVFNIGMIELLSYVKCTCSKNILVKAGYLSGEQNKWWKKLYYQGLGEFLYRNNIKINEEDLFVISSVGEKINLESYSYQGEGNLIPVGGGKDSIVTLELLKDYKNNCFVINPKEAHELCIKQAGYLLNDAFIIERKIDDNLIALNELGFLNGHTPFSAIVAFTSFLAAYLSNKKNIILSNESSANESTVLDSTVNHQYSKSFEFEQDFNYYADKYLNLEIKYFSLLRAFNETQIAAIFSNLKPFHSIFKSCNVGSKTKPWNWCGNCPKCLFVYIILSPYLSKQELMIIFGEDLLNKESLLSTFKELLGYSTTKPFECVGTYHEVRDAVSRSIEKYEGDLPFLLKYYQDNYPTEKYDLLSEFNNENNIPEEYIEVLKEALKIYVSKFN